MDAHRDSLYIRRKKEFREFPFLDDTIYKVVGGNEHRLEILLENRDEWLCNFKHWEDYSFEANLKEILE